METMDYRNALHRLSELVDHERIASPTRKRVRYDLRRMRLVLTRLGQPQLGIPTIHIAGTKGKGSTAAMCASVLSAQGYRTGLYTSPHLHTFRERIRLDGTPVSEDEFADLVEGVWPELEWVNHHGDLGEVTMFETLTAMAFCHFRKMADFQVIEVGLGGRLDTTNTVQPQVCAITSLSLDHTSVLGDTIEQIASEKAAIIKPGATVVTSPQPPEAMAVIDSACHEAGTKPIKISRDLQWIKIASSLEGQEFEVTGRLGNYALWTSLLGDFQLENATTAVGILEALKEKSYDISMESLQDGFRQAQWPCRMEVLNKEPLVVCDGAHNPYSAATLRDSLPNYFDYRKVLVVAGISQDKKLKEIVNELAPLVHPTELTALITDSDEDFGDPSPNGRGVWGEGIDKPHKKTRVIATRSRHPRAAPTAMVAEAFRSQHVDAEQIEDVDKAIARALEEATKDTLVLVTGSLFVAAEAREALKGIEPELYPEFQRDAHPTSR